MSRSMFSRRAVIGTTLWLTALVLALTGCQSAPSAIFSKTTAASPTATAAPATSAAVAVAGTPAPAGAATAAPVRIPTSAAATVAPTVAPIVAPAATAGSVATATAAPTANVATPPATGTAQAIASPAATSSLGSSVSAALSTATSHTVVRTAVPGLDPGWVLFENQDEGFALALPPNWKQVDMDPAVFDASLQALKDKDPSLAQQFEQQARSGMAQGIKFLGFDLGPDSQAADFATNVNVIARPLPVDLTLDQFTQLAVAQLQQTPNVSTVTSKKTTIAAGDAEQVSYHLTIGSGQDQAVAAITQYIVLRGRTAYVLSLTTEDTIANTYGTTFDKIGQSFQLLGPTPTP